MCETRIEVDHIMFVGKRVLFWLGHGERKDLDRKRGSQLTPGVMIIAGPRDRAGYNHPRIVSPSNVLNSTSW